MKTYRLAYPLLIATLLAAASCAGPGEMKMVNNGAIPAAESTVKVGTNDNGNTTFDLKVKHLARPERVDPQATVYVVWLRGYGTAMNTQNMGALKVDNNLDASYSGVTPLREFELFVTVEPTSAGLSPTGRTLLYKAVTARK
jgi:hypothetical protein